MSSDQSRTSRGPDHDTSEGVSERQAYTWKSDVVPDRSKSDYYCKTCDSHMNSEYMWECHIKGKRHLRNMKKEPDELPSKIKAVLTTDREPSINKLLKDVEEPIIGLDYMSELQRSEQNVEDNYTCYICHCSCNSSGVISHITSTKHRLKYLQIADLENFKLLDSLNLKNEALDSLVCEKAQECEMKEGRGKIEVKIERTKPVPVSKPITAKRTVDEDDGAGNRKRTFIPDDMALAGPSMLPGIDTNNIQYFNIDAKLRMLEELSQIEVKSGAECRVIMDVMQKLNQCLKDSMMIRECKAVQLPVRNISFGEHTVNRDFTCAITTHVVGQGPSSLSSREEVSYPRYLTMTPFRDRNMSSTLYNSQNQEYSMFRTSVQPQSSRLPVGRRNPNVWSH